jgi:hypothetical protein
VEKNAGRQITAVNASTERREEDVMLEKFFTVTTTSLYEVIAKGENGYPYVCKIDLHGESQISVGQTMTGDLLAVCKWLQLFIPEKYGLTAPMSGIERRVERVSTCFYQGKTSPVIALFLTEDKARECFASPDLQPCDPRWLDDTKEVLEAIGEDHPTITICHWPEMTLIA